MQIIRDEGNGLLMIPLMIEWGVRRCNVKDCTATPNTIIVGQHPAAPLFGLCEKHYQEGAQPGGTDLTIVFDDFDAFERDHEASKLPGGSPWGGAVP